MSQLKHLIKRNQEWVEKIDKECPSFFESLAQVQTPKYLWLGCSDSRVSPNLLLNLKPGEIFVHRNIANMVIHSDLSCISVMQYAIEVLKVEHVIVCGHYNCGGVKASMGEDQLGVIDNWLRYIKDVSKLHADQLKDLPEQKKFDLLCELNVREQVDHVCNSNFVKNAWAKGQNLSVHGWIYSLKEGLIKELENWDSESYPA
jgi:carbonic anhydrase